MERLRWTPSCARLECEGARCGTRGVSIDGRVECVGDVRVLVDRVWVSTAGLKYEVKWLYSGSGETGELSTEEASVTVSWEWILLFPASLSSLALDVEPDETCLISIGDAPSMVWALWICWLDVDTRATGDDICVRFTGRPPL